MSQLLFLMRVNLQGCQELDSSFAKSLFYICMFLSFFSFLFFFFFFFCHLILWKRCCWERTGFGGTGAILVLEAFLCFTLNKTTRYLLPLNPKTLGLQGDPTSPFWRRSTLGFLWKEWCWSWNSGTLATSCEELTHWKRLWCWEGLGAGGEGDDRGWDGWMASQTQWMWVWVNPRRWWWTGRPAVLRFMGSQRVGHDWATELNWTESKDPLLLLFMVTELCLVYVCVFLTTSGLQICFFLTH